MYTVALKDSYGRLVKGVQAVQNPVHQIALYKGGRTLCFTLQT